MSVAPSRDVGSYPTRGPAEPSLRAYGCSRRPAAMSSNPAASRTATVRKAFVSAPGRRLSTKTPPGSRPMATGDNAAEQSLRPPLSEPSSAFDEGPPRWYALMVGMQNAVKSASCARWPAA